MQQRFAGNYAMAEANRTGKPQTVYQSDWDDWEYCGADEAPALSRQAVATWLPTYYLSPVRY